MLTSALSGSEGLLPCPSSPCTTTFPHVLSKGYLSPALGQEPSGAQPLAGLKYSVEGNKHAASNKPGAAQPRELETASPAV